MIFDKNQKIFPSKEHNAIWSLGIHILPQEYTLPPQVRNNLPFYLIKSCEQMRGFFLHLLGDMYENIDLYLPLPYQLSRKIIRPFIDFGLMGEAGEDEIIINRFAFDKYIKKLKNNIDYEDDRKAGVSFDYRMKILERSGLKFEYGGGNVILTNSLYPNMFYALREMALITSKEKASTDNSFTYCDFRKLCKDYRYDKYENALVFLSDEQKEVTEKLEQIAKKYKMTKSVKSGHCPGYEITYNYKKLKVMTLDCLSSFFDTDLIKDGSNNYKSNSIIFHLFIPFDKNNPESLNVFLNSMESESHELKKFFLKKINRCRLCNPRCAEFNIRIFNKPQRLCCAWDSVNKVHSIKMKTGNISTEIFPFIEKILIYAVQQTGRQFYR